MTGYYSQLLLSFPEWLVIPESELPDNWQDMIIQDGKLVDATPEVLSARQAAEYSAAIESVRKSRETQYRSESDALLFDAIEAFAIAHPEYTEFKEWIAKKDEIRNLLPKPIKQ